MTDSSGSNFWRRPKNKWLFGIPLGALIAFGLGAVALGTFNTILHATGSNEFCYVCHSHEQFIKPEYEASTHFSNASGVRANCSDCHVPHDWWGTVWLKTRATLDILPEVTGKLDSAEKFEAHRREMATSVWSDYLDRDSSYCRTCHAFESMAFDKQNEFVSEMHSGAQEQGQSCIECHQGIVHKLPEKWRDAWKEASAD